MARLVITVVNPFDGKRYTVSTNSQPTPREVPAEHAHEARRWETMVFKGWGWLARRVIGTVSLMGVSGEDAKKVHDYVVHLVRSHKPKYWGRFLDAADLKIFVECFDPSLEWRSPDAYARTMVDAEEEPQELRMAEAALLKRMEMSSPSSAEKERL